jgi:hypothetical protein
MQRLEVSGAVRLIYRSLGVKGLRKEPKVSLAILFKLSSSNEELRKEIVLESAFTHRSQNFND